MYYYVHVHYIPIKILLHDVLLNKMNINLRETGTTNLAQ